MSKDGNTKNGVSIVAFLAAVTLILAVLGFLYANTVSRVEFNMVRGRLDRMERKIDRLLERE